jgi:hypothetical protein
MDSLSDGAVDEIAWMLELESVNIEIPRGEWSMLYSILQKNPNTIVFCRILYTSFRACLMPCRSAEKMLERLGRVYARLILREGMTTAHVVVLCSSDREPSV